MLCVLPGVFDVRANPFLCKSEFIKLDFPTFERPKKAISGKPPVVQCSRLNALFTNSAFIIFIFYVVFHTDHSFSNRQNLIA